jgi:hypothetical protein
MLRLERAMQDAKKVARAAARDLAGIWDRIDAGEPLNDEPYRLAVGAANDAAYWAKHAFIAEWKRVGCPRACAPDLFT